MAVTVPLRPFGGPPRAKITLMEEPAYVDVDGAARILRVSPQTVRRETRAGRIKAVKLGREWRYLVEDLRDLTRLQQPPRED